MIEVLKEPLVLKPDTFVEYNNTPWAGTAIGEEFKNDIIEGIAGTPIGESWEFSVSDDKLGSVEKRTRLPIKRCFEHKDLVYGESFHKARVGQNDDSELLVKLIDTDQRLSFQIHPSDEFDGLSGSECGKPEAWLILNSKKESGVYLGFKEGIDKNALYEKIKSQQDIENYLEFVKVEKYDYVRVPVLTPHAIGAGVTLIEPQLVRPGKRGKTYRISDWGRKYDSHGNLCLSGGAPRELHIEEALKLIDPEVQSGKEYLASLVVKPSRTKINDLIELLEYSDTVTGALNVVLGKKGSSAEINLSDGYLVITMIKGKIDLYSQSGSMQTLSKGQTVFVANAAECINIKGRSNYELTILSPENSKYSIK
jgi:mannose-6-phosphate isomerase